MHAALTFSAAFAVTYAKAQGGPFSGARGRASEIGVKGDTGAHAGPAEGNDRVLVIGGEQDHYARLGIDGDLRGLVLHAIHVRAGTWINEHDRPFLGQGALGRGRDADIVDTADIGGGMPVL